MKTKLLDLLKKENTTISDKYNEGMSIAMQTNIPTQLIQRFNRNGATENNTESLLYELKKHFNISNVDVVLHQVNPQKSNPTKRTKKNEKEDEAFANILRNMNLEAKEGLRFKTQYPFLQEEGTPVEFQELTASAFLAFDQFKQAHEELFIQLVESEEPQLSDEEVYQKAVQLLGDFEENRAIHTELEFYQKNKIVLGDHPVFEKLKTQRAIEQIPAEKLGTEKTNLTATISKKKSALKKATTEEDKTVLDAEIKKLEEKRNLINDRIKGAEKK